MGSHLSQYLEKEGHLVLGIDNDFHSCDNTPGGKVIDLDVRGALTKQVVVQFRPDIIIHLAAQIHVDYSIENPLETIDINVNGTLNMLEAAKEVGCKIVIASTSEAYGTSQQHYMNENHPLDCQSPYGASKVAADRLAKSYIDTYGMDIVIIRNFNAFGPYQNDGSYGSVISKFTKAAFAGEDLKIFGDGEQERDYMYIDDIIQAYYFAMGMDRGVYNFGTGETFKIKEIAEMIIKYTGSKSKIVHVAPRAGEVERLCCDISKARNEGFSPTTDFYRDLKKYVDWYGEYKQKG